MKFPIALAASLFCLNAWGQTSLTINQGEVYTVGVDQQRMTVDSLTIGDGASIRFAEGVAGWQLRALSAAIGSGVVIDAQGADGAAGKNGDGFAKAAKSCTSGGDATNGGDGSKGVDGLPIRLQLGLSSLGSLKILTNGGDGGAGGKGGDGQPAGEFGKACQNAPDGGDAGSGGDGGAGGNGGDVSLSYWLIDETMTDGDVVGRVIIESDAGAAGVAGKAGKPGAGSEGRFITKRSLSGNKTWVAGGKKGKKASTGDSGANGFAGRSVIEQALVVGMPQSSRARAAPAPASAPTKPQAEKSANQQEIRELKETLKALMNRLDELESKQ